MVTSEWGLPATFENGLVPEVLLAGQYGHKLHFWDLHSRKHKQEVDFGAENQLVFELRPAHDRQSLRLRQLGHQPQGSFRVDLDLVPQRQRMGG